MDLNTSNTQKVSQLRIKRPIDVVPGLPAPPSRLIYINAGIDLHQSMRHYAADTASKLLNS